MRPTPFGFSSWRTKTVNFRTAIFRQVNKDMPRVHHDALEFPDGTYVLLTDLREGQEATVLQLPAQPKTPAEEAAQRRVTYVGWRSPIIRNKTTSRRHCWRLRRPQTSQGAGIANGEARRQTIQHPKLTPRWRIGCSILRNLSLPLGGKSLGLNAYWPVSPNAVTCCSISYQKGYETSGMIIPRRRFSISHGGSTAVMALAPLGLAGH